jgi:NADH dehydrogenase
MNELPRVVIVGAGFGGLECARRLAGKPVSVTLLDRNNYHLFTPLLYQVASSLLNPSDIAHPIRSILRGAGNIRFRLCHVTGVHREARAVQTAEGDSFPYDFLVLAAGSATSFFGLASVEQVALGLKDLPEALQLRNHVLACFERAVREDDPEERRGWLHFVVVGGGPTGVEYAGALAELIRLVLARDFRSLDLSQVEVHLVEARDQVLGGFAPELGETARRELESKGIEVRLGAQVTEASSRGVTLSSGERLSARTLVWAAGVRPAGLVDALDLPRQESSGRVVVSQTLQVEGNEEVFAIGDMASFIQDGSELPMMAPPAQQQARHVARNILLLLQGREPLAFRYRELGVMATIGRNAAVAQVGRLRLRGFLGWVAWLLLHLYALVGFRNRLLVVLGWGWDYLFLDRPVRIISRARGRGKVTEE